MKKIILGISSSISAYKACDLTRLFVRDGYSVFPLLTENAAQLVSPLALEVLSGNSVYAETFPSERREMVHIELKKDADLFLVAPATANIIGKMANGIADDLLSTTYLSVKCPVLLAPAMNPDMWSHPAVQANIEKLKERGVNFIDPASGLVACGDEGTGRLADINDIFNAAKKLV
ncbi:MAG: phosphopantothenoylcysteine decarboxylase [Spirochaetes bacterium]|nr:phosphopantothenoylcysteine decarboxylase [Spirochaetota bacterium]